MRAVRNNADDDETDLFMLVEAYPRFIVNSKNNNNNNNDDNNNDINNDHVIDIDKQSILGFNGLQLASSYGKLNFVKYLIDVGGANVHLPTGGIKRTPFHEACYHGFVEVAQFLFDRGADINAKDVDGNTPFNLVIYDTDYSNNHEADHKAVAKFLIDNGADLESINKYGQTPLTLSLRYGRNNIIKLLINKGVKSTNLVMKRSSLNDDVFEFCSGTDDDIVDNNDAYKAEIQYCNKKERYVLVPNNNVMRMQFLYTGSCDDSNSVSRVGFGLRWGVGVGGYGGCNQWKLFRL